MAGIPYSSAQLTPKERMCRVLSGQRPDVLPAAPAYVSLFLEEVERDRYVEQYRRHLCGRTRYPVDHDEDTRFRAQALCQSYEIFKVKPDWLEIDQGASRAWAERTEILAQDGLLFYQDKVSGKRVPMHQVPMPRGDDTLEAVSAPWNDLWDISADLRSEEDVDARLPILSADELLARGDFDLPRQIVASHGNDNFLSTILDTPYCAAYDLLGFQGLMLIQHDRPALFHHLLQRELTQIQEAVKAWAAVGIHGVYAQEIFSGADLISSRSYDEFVFTYNRPYFRYMRAAGLLPIHYLCGDVIPRLERLVELDVAAIAVEESKKSFQIEIQEVVDRVAGRAAVFGNVDAVRFGLHATPEAMAAEVRRQASIGARAQGFVVSTGSPFPLDTDPLLVDTLIGTAHSIPG